MNFFPPFRNRAIKTTDDMEKPKIPNSLTIPCHSCCCEDKHSGYTAVLKRIHSGMGAQQCAIYFSKTGAYF